MLKADVIAAFPNQRTIARIAGVTQPRVSQWGEVVPELPARRIHDAHPEIPLRLSEDYGIAACGEMRA